MKRVDYQPLLIQDMLNYHRTGELNLTPWYQRRSTWTTPQKSYLINTLHEQKPVPAIYVRYYLDFDKAKTIREIVDGQQRTRTILEYCDNQFPAKHPSSRAKKLFSQLSRTEQGTFLLTAIPAGYLLGATDEDVIDIFGRINSISKTLNAQEKRNAKYSGEFKQFCLSQASSRLSLWRDYNLFSANDIARMIEVQFISDLVLNLLAGTVSDFSPSRIDSMYEKYEEAFPHEKDIADRLDRLFDSIISFDISSVRDTIFVRQPIFFSLLLVLDSLKSLDSRQIEARMHDIDNRYNDYDNHSEQDRLFYEASNATTQRVRQRVIRDTYIRGFLG
jgi:hypothetical protein